MFADLLAHWTPLAIGSAIISGVALGWVFAATASEVPTKVVAFRIGALGLLWYIGQLAAAWSAWGTFDSTLARLLLYLGAFVVPATVTYALIERRR